MSELIATDQQRLSQDALVVLFQLDASKFGAGILYFCPTSVDGASVKFGGVEYTPLPIAAEGFSWGGSGSLPRPTLSLSAPDLSFLSLVMSSEDFVGCPVTRLRTYRRFLDDGKSPNPEAVYPPDHYVIERKTSQKRSLLQFELSALMDQEGKMLPARQLLRDSCTHRFRQWLNGSWSYAGATCPYTAAAMYDRGGGVTTDPTLARCGKRLSDCKKHFGATAVLPFYGFPGVGRI